ncbi:MAG: type I 3-dehydroquinate dehydratase [Candidatus Poseidoniaceae archaeon]|nr:type I 3-dehydroquinate dehydratase [Candidatus Poseidoniaceae archaeon]
MPEPTICVALDSTNVDDMVDEAARASTAGADLVEVRFDRLYLTKPEPILVEQEDGEPKSVMPPEAEWPISDAASVDAAETIQKLKDSIAVPVVFTVRPPREGGFYPGTEDERMAILELAIDSGVSWIDFESSIEDSKLTDLLSAAKKKGCKIIYSSHDINGTPNSEDIASFVRDNGEKADLVKFCSTAHSHLDALQIVDAAIELKGEGVDYSVMAVNSGGDWARIHAPVLGVSMVYATLSMEHRISDKGLINVRDLRDAWTLLEY